MYEYKMTYPNELYHYGVPGMKWGRRRARRYANKADLARASARELDAKAERAWTKRGAAKKTQRANALRDAAKSYDTISKYGKKVAKLNSKADVNNKAAQAWTDKANKAKSKGKFTDAAKYEQQAKARRDRANTHKQKAKNIMDRKDVMNMAAKKASKKTKEAGRKAVETAKKKLK